MDNCKLGLMVARIIIIIDKIGYRIDFTWGIWLSRVHAYGVLVCCITMIILEITWWISCAWWEVCHPFIIMFYLLTPYLACTHVSLILLALIFLHLIMIILFFLFRDVMENKTWRLCCRPFFMHNIWKNVLIEHHISWSKDPTCLRIIDFPTFLSWWIAYKDKPLCSWIEFVHKFCTRADITQAIKYL